MTDCAIAVVHLAVVWGCNKVEILKIHFEVKVSRELVSDTPPEKDRGVKKLGPGLRCPRLQRSEAQAEEQTTGKKPRLAHRLFCRLRFRMSLALQN